MPNIGGNMDPTFLIQLTIVSATGLQQHQRYCCQHTKWATPAEALGDKLSTDAVVIAVLTNLLKVKKSTQTAMPKNMCMIRVHMSLLDILSHW